ncbi:hypothetical protein QQ045_006188 [Rhodiola kirilowii]
MEGSHERAFIPSELVAARIRMIGKMPNKGSQAKRLYTIKAFQLLCVPTLFSIKHGMEGSRERAFIPSELVAVRIRMIRKMPKKGSHFPGKEALYHKGISAVVRSDFDLCVEFFSVGLLTKLVTPIRLCSSVSVNQFKQIYRLSNVFSNNVCAIRDRIVSVRRIVVKVSTVKPLVLQMSFECAKCSCKTICNFPDYCGKLSPPTSCGMQGCRSRTFNPLRVQEMQRSENHEEGRVPRTVECEVIN